KSMAHPIVVHLCFEAGYEFVGLDSMVPQHEPLAYILWYEKTEFIKREDFISSTLPLELELCEFPTQNEYKKKFDLAYDHLLKGNCYQINLTYRFYFRLLEKIGPMDFLSRVWQKASDISSFAHASYISPMEKLVVSNS